MRFPASEVGHAEPPPRSPRVRPLRLAPSRRVRWSQVAHWHLGVVEWTLVAGRLGDELREEVLELGEKMGECFPLCL